MSFLNERLTSRPCYISEILLISAAYLVLGLSAYAQTADISGQAAGWATMKRDDSQAGLRYIPALSLMEKLSANDEISAEAAVNARWFSQYDRADSRENTSTIAPYRLWTRFASSHYEVRAGLQKISFGSATLLRPLMWFDSVDPRDPLQLTNGVYGLLGRYYFSNNVNIWVWALYGNDDLKGWETLPTDKKDIERGGRIQAPVPAGELGISYHQRRVAPEGTAFRATYPMQGAFPEDRFGLDGKWDVGAGVWFEGTATRRGFGVPEPRYLRLLTVGADYTFELGNGLHVLFEQFVRDEAEHIFESGKGNWFSAVLLDYPLSMLDKVTAIAYYDRNGHEWSRVLQWRRTYDKWQVYVSGFRNPEQTTLVQDTTTFNSYTGNGVQLMLVFNH